MPSLFSPGMHFPGSNPCACHRSQIGMRPLHFLQLARQPIFSLSSSGMRNLQLASLACQLLKFKNSKSKLMACEVSNLLSPHANYCNLQFYSRIAKHHKNILLACDLLITFNSHANTIFHFSHLACGISNLLLPHANLNIFLLPHANMSNIFDIVSINF